MGPVASKASPSVLATDAPVKEAEDTATTLLFKNATEANCHGPASPSVTTATSSFAKTGTANPSLTTGTRNYSLPPPATSPTPLSMPAKRIIPPSPRLEKTSSIPEAINTLQSVPTSLSRPAEADMKAAERATPSPVSKAIQLTLSPQEASLRPTGTAAHFISVKAMSEDVKAAILPRTKPPGSTSDGMTSQEITGSRSVSSRSAPEIPSEASKISMALVPGTKNTQATRPPYTLAAKDQVVTTQVLRTKITTFSSLETDDFEDIEVLLEKVCQGLQSRFPLKHCEPKWNKPEVIQIVLSTN
ncbi:endochitinase A-like isoform X2 [Rhinatrema bivittatum]|uniref:endochitinase A-like isoform X2 n=1 Tax=Rhinatrema bivittatum TaxID=194408 RepID=UPI00112E4843|nr:endochitinase A-like isoform X2 [Rhinatrema bivittatum]